jgi:hypothetical protein
MLTGVQTLQSQKRPVLEYVYRALVAHRAGLTRLAITGPSSELIGYTYSSKQSGAESMCRSCLPLSLCEDQESQGEGSMFENDSWFDWHPDPEQAFREHDPTLEPYASMSKHALLEAMHAAQGGRQWEFLREFLLDKCTGDELRSDGFMALLQVDGKLEREEFIYLSEVAAVATRLQPSPKSSTDRNGRDDKDV